MEKVIEINACSLVPGHLHTSGCHSGASKEFYPLVGLSSQKPPIFMNIQDGWNMLEPCLPQILQIESWATGWSGLHMRRCPKGQQDGEDKDLPQKTMEESSSSSLRLHRK